jgi:hypothetical protein
MTPEAAAEGYRLEVGMATRCEEMVMACSLGLGAFGSLHCV